MQRDKIISFVSDYLGSDKVRDSSQNGLQVEGRPEVKKIVFGVSASLELFKRAAAADADMIIVHHGLFWGHPLPVTGALKRKLSLLLDKDISLAAWHLPLDKHPVVGNNARILKLLGASTMKPFGSYDGEVIGFKGIFNKPKAVSDISGLLRRQLDANITSLNFGPGRIKTLAVVSGGGQRMFEQALAEGLDLYITGEISEFVQETARENRANYIAAGHYNTEKPGVWALEDLLRARFKVKTEFIDVPNPV